MAEQQDEMEGYTDAQLRIIAEIQRIAETLGVTRLSQREFDSHHTLGGVTSAGELFGSWNQAVVAAGLTPYPPGGDERGPVITDDELLQEIIRVHNHIGKQPSERQMAAFGNYSLKPYKERWGGLPKAREEAYSRFGSPPNRPQQTA